MIGCTAHIDESIIESCERAGMDLVLVKPLLKDKIKEVLKDKFS